MPRMEIGIDNPEESSDSKRANLRGADLKGANLRHIYLAEVDLSGADLRNADLSGAYLRGAAFDDTVKLDRQWHLVWDIVNNGARGRDLRGAVLRGANLSGADLGGADLHGADLRDVRNLHATNFSGVDLSGLDFRGANLEKADLSEANLCDADLRAAWLFQANLEGANLENANLSRASLCEADLRYANLHGASLTGTNLDGAELEGAVLPGSWQDEFVLSDDIRSAVWEELEQSLSDTLSLDMLESRLRPNVFSIGGFLGPEEMLRDVLEKDRLTLVRLGLTYEDLASAIQMFLEEDWQGRDLSGHYCLWQSWFCGEQSCPWVKSELTAEREATIPAGTRLAPTCGHPVQFASTDWWIINLETGLSVSGPGMIVHLIRYHHFFEGPASPYRVNPERAAMVLGLVVDRS